MPPYYNVFTRNNPTHATSVLHVVLSFSQILTTRQVSLGPVTRTYFKSLLRPDIYYTIFPHLFPNLPLYDGKGYAQAHLLKFYHMLGL